MLSMPCCGATSYSFRKNPGFGAGAWAGLYGCRDEKPLLRDVPEMVIVELDKSVWNSVDGSGPKHCSQKHVTQLSVTSANVSYSHHLTHVGPYRTVLLCIGWDETLVENQKADKRKVTSSTYIADEVHPHQTGRKHDALLCSLPSGFLRMSPVLWSLVTCPGGGDGSKEPLRGQKRGWGGAGETPGEETPELDLSGEERVGGLMCPHLKGQSWDLKQRSSNTELYKEKEKT